MTAEVGAVRSVGWDVKVLALVGSGHFLSHFYAIVLPPLFPLLAADLSVSYAALGLLLTVAALATSALQLPVGVLVDRFGGRPVLAVGLGVVSAAVIGMGLTDGYALLLGCALLFGLGNSV
ncbi:MAG TPA: MFS transporter, partial [Kiloniellales bacterium]|nr:MFS transporter [Kiloniellales bacterium]